jgi:uncharacterized protein YbaR (Trm112 family)
MTSDTRQQAIESMPGFGYVVLELDCPDPDCDGNFAWLLNKTTQRVCRKCGRPIRLEDSGVPEMLVEAAATRL